MADLAARQRRTLSNADRARSRGRTRAAVRLYRRALEHAPTDARVHQKLAPLLAQRRAFDESWQSFQIVCDALVQKGFDDRAAGLLREAVTLLPRKPEAWERLAELETSLGRSVDAHLALMEGRRHFRRRRDRAEARRLLERAVRIDPNHPQSVLDLARLRKQTGDRAGAGHLLEQLIERHPGAAAAGRRALFWVRPGFRTMLGWLRPPGRPAVGEPLARARPTRP